MIPCSFVCSHFEGGFGWDLLTPSFARLISFDIMDLELACYGVEVSQPIVIEECEFEIFSLRWDLPALDQLIILQIKQTPVPLIKAHKHPPIRHHDVADVKKRVRVFDERLLLVEPVHWICPVLIFRMLYRSDGN